MQLFECCFRLRKTGPFGGLPGVFGLDILIMQCIALQNVYKTTETTLIFNDAVAVFAQCIETIGERVNEPQSQRVHDLWHTGVSERTLNSNTCASVCLCRGFIYQLRYRPKCT